jgi:hypothetical protein
MESPLSVAGEGAAKILGIELPPVVEEKTYPIEPAVGIQLVPFEKFYLPAQAKENPSLDPKHCYFCGIHSAIDCQRCESDLTKKAGFQPKAAKPASEAKSCKNCGNGPKHSKKCEAKECTPVNDRTNRFSFANWTPKPTSPAKPEPVEPWEDPQDDGNHASIRQLQRKHDALEAMVREMAGGK